MSKQRFLRKKTLEKSKQISEKIYDPFQEFQGNKYELFFAKVFYYIRTNFKLFLVISSIAIITIISLLTYNIYIENLEYKALLEYEELQRNPILQPGGAEISSAISKLDSYIQKYNLESVKKRAILKKIELYEYNKDYENLAIQYEELSRLLKYPELKAYFLIKSAVYFEMNKKYTRALSNIDEILKQKIDNTNILANVFFLQSRILYNLGKKEDSIRIAQKILEINEPDNHELKNLQLKVLAYILTHQNSSF